jgi:succinylarginine dihydrolase
MPYTPEVEGFYPVSGCNCPACLRFWALSEREMCEYVDNAHGFTPGDRRGLNSIIDNYWRNRVVLNNDVAPLPINEEMTED